MRIHPRRFIFLTALVVAIAAVPGEGRPGAAYAGSLLQPQPISHLATRTDLLTEREREEVEAYARYWIDRMATGDPDAIRSAVRALDEPLNRIGVTRVFRDDYSRAAIPLLEELVAGRSNNEVAVNAMKVAALFYTDRAMRLMVDRSDPRREDRKAVRLWAANGFRTIVQSGLLEARQLTGPVRDLARAAAQEENWLVLRRQFEALAQAPGSLDHQMAVFRAAINHIMEEERVPNPSMQSLHRALVLFRDQWLNMDARAQQTFGTAAGPEIVRVLELADAHWEKAQEHERARGWYRAASAASETLLLAIDLQVRPNSNAPQPALDAAWQRGDRAAFQRHLQTWLSITSRPPY